MWLRTAEPGTRSPFVCSPPKPKVTDAVKLHRPGNLGPADLFCRRWNMFFGEFGRLWITYWWNDENERWITLMKSQSLYFDVVQGQKWCLPLDTKPSTREAWKRERLLGASDHHWTFGSSKLFRLQFFTALSCCAFEGDQFGWLLNRGNACCWLAGNPKGDSTWRDLTGVASSLKHPMKHPNHSGCSNSKSIQKVAFGFPSSPSNDQKVIEQKDGKTVSDLRMFRPSPNSFEVRLFFAQCSAPCPGSKWSSTGCASGAVLGVFLLWSSSVFFFFFLFNSFFAQIMSNWTQTWWSVCYFAFSCSKLAIVVCLFRACFQILGPEILGSNSADQKPPWETSLAAMVRATEVRPCGCWPVVPEWPGPRRHAWWASTTGVTNSWLVKEGVSFE